MILFINACVRKESRTKQLADYLISRLNDRVEEVRLEDISFPVTDRNSASRSVSSFSKASCSVSLLIS